MLDLLSLKCNVFWILLLEGLFGVNTGLDDDASIFENAQIRVKYSKSQPWKISFTNFDDLKALESISTTVDVRKFNSLDYASFYLIPNEYMSLDRQINLTKLAGIRQIYLYLSFVNGIDDRKFDFRFGITTASLYVHFIYSKFNPLKCDANSTDEPRRFVRFSFNTGCRLSERTCKFFFKSTFVELLSVTELSESFVRRNRLGFWPNDHSSGLNSSVSQLNVQVYRIKIDSRLMDVNVFERLEIFRLDGRVGPIDRSVFVAFKNLRLITFNVANVGKVLTSADEWLFTLNRTKYHLENETNLTLNMNNLLIVGTFSKLYLEPSMRLDVPYLFPDEDFCSFVNFPFEQLIFLNPHMNCRLAKCSCTMLWLFQYVHLIGNSQFARDFMYKHMNTEGPFEFTVSRNETSGCMFEKRISVCKNSRILLSGGYGMDRVTFHDELFYSRVVEFLLIILTPIVCSIGLFTNTINIVVTVRVYINNKAPDDQKQRSLLGFMCAYSAMNLVYCVIHAISLVSKCVDEEGIYCPRVHRTLFAQYFKIVCVQFVSNVLKSLSNLAYFFISLNRYILLCKDGKLAGRLLNTQLSTKSKLAIILGVLIVTGGLHVNELIIYAPVAQSNIFKFTSTNYPQLFVTFPMFISESFRYEYYSSSGPADQAGEFSVAYEALAIINFVLDDLLLFVSFTVLDILLIVAFRKLIEQKKDSLNRVGVDPNKLQEQINEIEQTEEKMLKVIATNTVVYFLIKVFDVFMKISKFKIWKSNLVDAPYLSSLNEFCYTVKICDTYEELVKVLYLICYSFSFVVFYHFNKNFRSQFRSIFTRLKKETNFPKKQVNKS